MRVKISIKLDRAAGACLLNLERQARDLRDIEIINRVAERLNREAKDTLDYQQLPSKPGSHDPRKQHSRKPEEAA